MVQYEDIMFHLLLICTSLRRCRQRALGYSNDNVVKLSRSFSAVAQRHLARNLWTYYAATQLPVSRVDFTLRNKYISRYVHLNLMKNNILNFNENLIDKRTVGC